MTQNQIAISPPEPHWGTPQDTDFHVVLVSPEIPPNTGSIARLCAATGACLHLVKPLGFELHSKHLKRAGLDYWPNVRLTVHEDFSAVERIFDVERLHLFSTHATINYASIAYQPGDVLVFGRETKGLGEDLRARYAERLRRIPVRRGAVRSLNLAGAVSIALYETLRQQDFPGM